MTGAPWGEVKALFQRLVELPEDERAAVLAAEAGDAAVRREVERLLAGDRHAAAFLERPPGQPIGGSAGPAAEAGAPTLGAYRIESEIGSGGMGVVYESFRDDGQFRKRVAIKLLKRGLDTDDVLRRFHLERRILGRLDHPNIAQIYDAGTSGDGRPFFVMEYVDGVPIDVYCRRSPLEERIRLFREVCAAVHYAHQNLIAHRDLKPSNVLVTADGAPKLLDFGIAKILDPSASLEAVTHASQQRFTPAFASPEQARGEPITTASDIYSLGVLLYRLLTERHPYALDGRSSAEIAAAICEAEPLRPSRVETATLRLPRDVDAIVLRSLAKAPAERYASAIQLSADLERYLEGLPVLAREPTLSYRLGKFLRRHKLAAAIGGLVLLAVGMTAGLSLRLARSLADTRAALALADREASKARASSAFLVDLFRDANPRGPLGGQVTLREVLALGARRAREGLADEPLVQATLMDAIGRVYIDLGDLDAAAPLLEAALEHRQRLLEETHPDLMTSLDHLGMLRREQRHPEAEPMIRRALDIRRRHLGPDDPQLAESLTNLGGLLFAQGRHAAAESMFREALRVRQVAFEPPHAKIAESQSNLASALLARGEPKPAIELYERALDSYQRTLGQEHPDLAVSLQNLALALYAAGEEQRASPLLRRALEILRQRLGAAHPDVLEAIANAAGKALEHGDVEYAHELASEVLSRREEIGGDGSRQARDRRLMARILAASGDVGGAERQLRRALAERRGADPSDPKGVATTLVSLGALLVDDRRAAEAEAHLRSAVRLRRAHYPASDRRIALAESVLADCLVALGQWREAERLLRSSLPIIRRAYGPSQRLRLRAEERLARYCAARSPPDRIELCGAESG